MFESLIKSTRRYGTTQIFSPLKRNAVLLVGISGMSTLYCISYGYSRGREYSINYYHHIVVCNGIASPSIKCKINS